MTVNACDERWCFSRSGSIMIIQINGVLQTSADLESHQSSCTGEQLCNIKAVGKSTWQYGILGMLAEVG